MSSSSAARVLAILSIPSMPAAFAESTGGSIHTIVGEKKLVYDSHLPAEYVAFDFEWSPSPEESIAIQSRES